MEVIEFKEEELDFIKEIVNEEYSNIGYGTYYGTVEADNYYKDLAKSIISKIDKAIKK